MITAGGSVLVVGLGDLGRRVLWALAGQAGIGRLAAGGRDAAAGGAVAGQARLISRLAGGPAVEFAEVDLLAEDDACVTLRRLDPDVIVMAASLHTWWRGVAGSPGRRPAAGLPYGAWLPAQVYLVRRLMRARRQAGIRAPVVCLPYPDAVGRVLAADGLAPQIGGGNVAEVAAKIAVLAAGRSGRQASEVTVRLVMHHSCERMAFAAFGSLAGGLQCATSSRIGDLWAAEVTVGDRALPADEVEQLFTAPYPLPDGRETQQLTAATVVEVVLALLSDTPTALHAPAPGGRPGGYPVTVSRTGMSLDLPTGMGEAAAVAMNERAAALDGIAGLDADGTIVWTPGLRRHLGELGMPTAPVAQGDQDAWALELLARTSGGR